MADLEDRDWQRLDKWLWCARLLRARSDCAALVAAGGVRLNRQPTSKPHAKLRIGDTLTVPLRGEVRVLEVCALAARRGPANAALLLYREIPPPDAAPQHSHPCSGAGSAAYRRP